MASTKLARALSQFTTFHQALRYSGRRFWRESAESGARPELSTCGACAAAHQGSSPEWAETRAEIVGNSRGECAAPGATRLEPGPKGTHEKVYRSKHRSNFWLRTGRST
jgi:hypothetical protein